MNTMTLHIDMCGTHSITGCVMDKVLAKGAQPERIIININTVMLATDVYKELAKARKSYAERPFTIELGTVKKDLYKEDLAKNPGKALCFS